MILVDDTQAALYTGRRPSTIRVWASQGRITRYGSGRSQVRYDLDELPHAHRCPASGELFIPEPPPLPGHHHTVAV